MVGASPCLLFFLLYSEKETRSSRLIVGDMEKVPSPFSAHASVVGRGFYSPIRLIMSSFIIGNCTRIRYVCNSAFQIEFTWFYIDILIR